MIELQYFNGNNWETISTWNHEWMAWASLGGDNLDYRTVDARGKVLTSHCDHDWTMTADSFDQTCYCRKCGKSN